MSYLQSDVRAGPLWHPPNNGFRRHRDVCTPDVNSVVVPVSVHFCLPSSITWYVTPERGEDRIKVQERAVFKTAFTEMKCYFISSSTLRAFPVNGNVIAQSTKRCSYFLKPL